MSNPDSSRCIAVVWRMYVARPAAWQGSGIATSPCTSLCAADVRHRSGTIPDLARSGKSGDAEYTLIRRNHSLSRAFVFFQRGMDRSLRPLPWIRTTAGVPEASATRNETSSETRAPVLYISANMVRSRWPLQVFRSGAFQDRVHFLSGQMAQQRSSKSLHRNGQHALRHGQDRRFAGRGVLEEPADARQSSVPRSDRVAACFSK